MTDEQRSRTGWIGVPKCEVILARPLSLASHRTKAVKCRRSHHVCSRTFDVRFCGGKSLQPGMVLAIEQGVAPPDGPRVALEDDVLVTDTGHEWLSRSIPIEIDEVEAMAAEPSRISLGSGVNPVPK